MLGQKAAEELSKRSSNRINNTIRESLVKHYESGWKNWCSWCVEKKISPTRCGLKLYKIF